MMHSTRWQTLLAKWGMAVVLSGLFVAVFLLVAVGLLGMDAPSPLLLWLYSRTVGLPFGPNPGIPESIGLADVLAGLLEVTALLAASLLLRARTSAAHPPASAHRRAFILVAVIAVTAIGLFGAAPNWFDDSGSSGEPPTMVAPA